MSKIEDSLDGLWGWVKPKFWPVIISGVASAAYVGIKYVPPSNVIASAPDRIIPAASSNMAKGALNPDLLEVRVCDANTDEPGKELLFVYDGKRQIGTVGPDRDIVIVSYEADGMYAWRCR